MIKRLIKEYLEGQAKIVYKTGKKKYFIMSFLIVYFFLNISSIIFSRFQKIYTTPGMIVIFIYGLATFFVFMHRGLPQIVFGKRSKKEKEKTSFFDDF